MKGDRTFRVIAIAALIFGVSGLTLAYAATLSSQLDVNGTVTATGTGGTWDVHFTETGSTCTVGGAACTGTNKLTVTPALVTFSATLEEGQEFAASVPIENKGSFLATKVGTDTDPCTAILAQEVETTEGETKSLNTLGFTCTTTFPSATIAAETGTSTWGVNVAYPANLGNDAPSDDVVINYAYSVSYQGTNN